MFGPTINGLIQRHTGSERCLLWESKREGGKPDTMSVLKRAHNCWRAKGLVIHFTYAMLVANTSSAVGFHHPKLHQEFKDHAHCKEAGISVFGTLWGFVRFGFLFSDYWRLTYDR
jgi:hypothetical protein